MTNAHKIQRRFEEASRAHELTSTEFAKTEKVEGDTGK
jgi:hypothetical protein